VPAEGGPARRPARIPALRRLVVDLTPLRVSRDFRLLWGGELVSQFGSQIMLVALFVQVYELTGSVAAVGLIGLVQFVPMVLVALGVGPQIDLRDRRVLLLGAEVGLALASVVLLGGVIAGDPPLVLVYGAAALNAASASLSLAARAAMTPNLVPAGQLAQASALNHLMWNAAGVLGPAVGGVIVGRAGLAWAYGIDVASYAVALGCVFALRPQRPDRTGADPGDRGWQAVLNGFRYLRGKRVLQSTFTIDLVAMIFGMPRALFPVLAVEQFGRGPEAVGWLFSAIALGATLGGLGSGWVGRVRHHGRAILIAVSVWGLAIVGFGLSGDRLPVAFACLAVAGAADMISAVFRGTLQQLVVPDALRGRLVSFNVLVVAGGPRIGDAEAGFVAAAFSPTVSVVSGGLLCLAGVAFIAAAVPAFSRWTPGDPA